MPASYKILTCLIALVGSSSLLLTEGMLPFFLLTTPFVLVGYYRAAKGYPQAHRFITGGLSTLALILFFIDIKISRDVISAVGHLTMFFHAIKAFDMKDPWDPLQVFFMALIQLLLASEITRSMIFGVIFLVFMAGMVLAMFYSHIIKEGAEGIKGFLRPMVTMTLLLILLTTVFFLVLPRFRGSLFGRPLSKGIKSGFSEKVSLGSLGSIKLDPTVVMRISVRPERGFKPYWRGMTYDIYSGNTWRSLRQGFREYKGLKGVFKLSEGEIQEGFRQEVILEPLETDLIFGLRGAFRLVIDSKSLGITDSGDLYIPRKKGKRVRYLLQSTNRPFKGSSASPVYLQLPEDMQWITGFTGKIIAGLNDGMEMARAIESFLRNNYTYSLVPSVPPPNINPVRYFLLEEKKGYCEHYATSMVLMLRSAGIPARVVSGYMGGEYNRYGRYYIVRQKDAHTWVEAFIDGTWVRFDPTPAVETGENSPLFLYLDLLKMKWERYVVGYSSSDQKRLFRVFERPVRRDFWRMPELEIKRWPLYLMILLLITGIAGFVLLKRRQTALSTESRYYLRIRKRLNRDYPVNASLTAKDILAIIEKDREVYPYLKEFLLLYEAIRFSNRTDEDHKKRYFQLYGLLKKKLRNK